MGFIFAVQFVSVLLVCSAWISFSFAISRRHKRKSFRACENKISTLNLARTPPLPPQPPSSPPKSSSRTHYPSSKPVPIPKFHLSERQNLHKRPDLPQQPRLALAYCSSPFHLAPLLLIESSQNPKLFRIQYISTRCRKVVPRHLPRMCTFSL
jgi:hypothetical protein